MVKALFAALRGTPQRAQRREVNFQMDTVSGRPFRSADKFSVRPTVNTPGTAIKSTLASSQKD